MRQQMRSQRTRFNKLLQTNITLIFPLIRMRFHVRLQQKFILFVCTKESKKRLTRK